MSRTNVLWSRLSSPIMQYEKVMPSLKNLCGVRCLVEILNLPHIKKEIFSFPINEYNYEERDDALQRVVSELLEDYNLLIKENIPKHLIIFIGFEITKWAEYLKECFGLSFNFSKHFIKSSFFTSEGLLDEEKAARELLKEQSFSLFLKYKIACQYFLEDVIPGLWKELRNDESNFKERLMENNPGCPMVMWSDYLEEINSSSELNQKIKTRHFKERVFSYGLKNKNLAAIKFSYGPKEEYKETKEEVKLVRKLVSTKYFNFIRRALKHIEFYEISTNSLFSKEFVADRNIIKHFLNFMNKEELKEFFLRYDDPFYAVSWFLLWPYQYQFMDFVHIILENFGILEYRKLMYDIILLINDKYMSQFYNYRLLLREVWIKSPAHLKEQIIRSEPRNELRTRSIITMLFTLPNFTDHDLENANLILKYADSHQRHRILMLLGFTICNHLIVSHNNFRSTEMFLKAVDLNQEILQQFKNLFPFINFDKIMMKKSITLFEDIFKWVVGSDKIDDLKDQIFHKLTGNIEIEYFFLELEEEVPFSFLNKVLKWFLKTDENIKVWQENIVYSHTIGYTNPKWFDRFLKYRGYSDEEASDIKRDIIFGNLPEIARLSYILVKPVRFSFPREILVLSFLKEEELLEINELLRSFYEDSIKQKMCVLCLDSNSVHVNGEGRFYCESHIREGLVTLEDIDLICSSVNIIDYNYLLEKTKRD